MNKSELLSTYTAEQLAGMVINLQGASEVKNDEIHKLKWQISSLEEENGRLQAKLDTYNGCLLPKCTKEARRMIDENRFANVKIVTWDEWNNRENKTMNISEIQKCQEEYERILKESPLQRTIDGIAKDILEQKNNAMAMEFTKAICGLLGKNGVRINCKETKHQNIMHNLIEEKYGIIFDSVDFSQHDKEFTDKIEELKKENDELKTENAELHCEMQAMSMFPDEFPTEPIKVADMLIDNATAVYENYVEDFAKAYSGQLVIGNPCEDVRRQTLSYLRQIAEHLLVYCGHNVEGRNGAE